MPVACRVVFLADCGFADTQLMRASETEGVALSHSPQGKFLDRSSGSEAFPGPRYLLGTWPCPVLASCQGDRPALWLVHLAVARPSGSNDYWYVVSDEPTEVKTLQAYGFRFDIEENFLDDKSNGFQLESSLIRSAKALERLCLVLAMTTLYLVSQGTSVVKRGKRRLVDPHWSRGTS